MDEAHKKSDAYLKQVERRVQQEYAQAAAEIQNKLEDYFRRYEVKNRIKLEKLKTGEITADEYKRWRTGQIMIGKRWEEMRDTLAQDLSHVNEIAASIVNGYTPEVYALNHNYGTYEAEKGSLVDTSYTLYDRQTVERLMRSSSAPIPRAKVDIPKDLRWNQRQVTSAVMQSILQGESIKQAAKRIAVTTAESNMHVATRNARTMITSAENAGRTDSYKRATNMGIEMKQVWLATLDGRTRHSHRQLDGEKIEIGGKFSNGCKYPGDPYGPAWEVYNCRCTLVAEVEGINQSDAPRNSKLGDMTYDEWKNEHDKKSKKTSFGDKVGKATFFDSSGGSHSVVVSIMQGINFGDGTGSGIYYTKDADVYTLDNGMEVVYPHDLNSNKQTLNPDLLIQRIYDMPDDYRDMMQKKVFVVDYRNPQDVYWEKKYGMKDFQSYATGGDDITFYAYTHHDPNYLSHTLAHEGGHYIDEYLNSRISMGPEWSDAVARDLSETGFDAPSDYARTTAKNNPGYFVEDFADSCAEYVYNHDFFVANFPNRAKILERILKNGKS